MKATWERFRDAFNARPLRERVVIALMALALVYVVWDLLVYRSLSAREQALQTRYDVASRTLSQLTLEEKVLAQALASNPNTRKQREIVELEKRLAELDRVLAELAVGLIPAQRLPDVLRDVVHQRRALTLLGMQAHAPKHLELEQPSAQAQGDPELAPEVIPADRTQRVGIFKHEVHFAVSGRYFDLLEYLAALERSGWSFYWSSLEYDVTRYPEAEVHLNAYTLSTERGFIRD